MAKLKQLACSVEVGPKNIPLREYNTKYGDGFVKTFICVPSDPVNFSIHLTSSGYIAPGLAMFVFIDGVLQCNRNRLNLVIPSANRSSEETQIDFRVRQKEDRISAGRWIGRGWSFAQLNTAADLTVDASDDSIHNIGTIEVIVLRCHGSGQDRKGHRAGSDTKTGGLKKDEGGNSINTSDHTNLRTRLFGGLLDGPSDEYFFPIHDPRLNGRDFRYDGRRDPYDWRHYHSPRYDHLLSSPLVIPAYESHAVPKRNEHDRGDPLQNWGNVQDAFLRHGLLERDEYKHDYYPRQHEKLRYGGQDGTQRSFQARGDLEHDPYFPNYIPPRHFQYPPQAPSTPPSQRVNIGPLTSPLSGNRPDDHNFAAYQRYARNPGDGIGLKPDEPGLMWLPEQYARERAGWPASHQYPKNMPPTSNYFQGQRYGEASNEHFKSPQATAADIERHGWPNATDGQIRIEIEDGEAEKKKKTSSNSSNHGQGSNKSKADEVWGDTNNNNEWGRNDNSWNNNDNGWSQNNNSWNDNNDNNGGQDNSSWNNNNNKNDWGSNNNNNQWGDDHKNDSWMSGHGNRSNSKEGSVARRNRQNGTTEAGPKDYEFKASHAGKKEDEEFDPTVLPIKSYWTPKSPEENEDGEKGRSPYVVAEEPLRRVPESIAREQGMSHQVQPGKGALYTNSVGRPRYLDSINHPYAVFIFKYRSKEMLEKILDAPVRESKEPIRQRLDAMTKEEIIEWYLRAKKRADPSGSEDDSLPGSPVLSPQGGRQDPEKSRESNGGNSKPSNGGNRSNGNGWSGSNESPKSSGNENHSNGNGWNTNNDSTGWNTSNNKKAEAW